VRARVVEREELAVDIKQGDRLAFDVAQRRLAGLDFVCLRYLHNVSHGSFLPSTRFPPLAIVSAQGLLSDAKRHFGKKFSATEF
jgi:hypothetical protein